MKETRKKIFKQHYASRTYLILMIIAPILGLWIVLSSAEILPRYGLTADMTLVTGSLIFAATCLISVLLYVALNKTITEIATIVEEGIELEGTILKATPSKHAVTVKYSFEFDNESCENSIHVAKRIGTRKEFAVGTTHKIYAMRNEQNKIESTLAIFG